MDSLSPVAQLTPRSCRYPPRRLGNYQTRIVFPTASLPSSSKFQAAHCGEVVQLPLPDSQLSSLVSSNDLLWRSHASGMRSGHRRARICGCMETPPPSSSKVQPPAVLPDSTALPPPPGGGGGLNAWLQLSMWLFLFGCGLGPPLDGLHSAVGLQTYDVDAVTIGGEPYGLHTSFWAVMRRRISFFSFTFPLPFCEKVFPLLGLFYSILGVTQLVLDCQLSKPGQFQLGSWLSVLPSVSTLIGLLRLSAQLYEDELPYLSEFAVLAVCAHVNWYIFDRSWWGYLLAALVALAAPASELVLMRYFGLWHYENPDIIFGSEGVVSWTSCCYFFYTQWVATLARCLAGFLLPKKVVQKFLPLESEHDTPKN